MSPFPATNTPGRPRIVEREAERVALTREVLDTLPAWFADPAAKARYVKGAAGETLFACCDEDGVTGILTLRRHFAETFEIHLLGVKPHRHRSGYGRTLVATAAAFAAESGARFLTVKTLGPSRQDAAYAKTRAFYAAVGFSPLEEFLSFWRDPPAPCLFLVRPVP